MCGRFTLTASREELIERFQLDLFPVDYMPSYNVAPSQQVLTAVQAQDRRRAGFLKWGLVPFWVKDPKKWKPLINARAESLHEKASFKHLLAKRRCIIFADSFYEWNSRGGKRVPFRILLKEERPFAFAGLWDRNQHGDRVLTTCTIITTEANEKVSTVHDRMPVILQDDAIERWLDTERFNYDEVRDLLRPFPADRMALYRVSTLVNSPKNN
ncbi:MAG: SOS response-associated peptidase, partial [Caldibacillus sp.]